MNYQNTQENRRKVLIGSATVNLILAVSFAATIAYWFVLSGLENSIDLPAIWYFLLWLIVGVGAVSEVIKKVTLSAYRHAVIWLVATAVSVLTVMGTYAILNANRQDQITKASDVYQDGRAMSQQGLHDATKYAHAANYNLADLESQLATVVCKRGSGHGAGAECGGGISISYASYLSQKKELEQKIIDAKAYQNAMGTAQIGKTQMESGGSTNSSSNPLLSDIAAVTGASEKLLINLFYLAVTLLLECAAFFIGGKVEELKLEMRHTAAELLELQNKAIFGVTIAQLLGGELPQRRPTPAQNQAAEANQTEAPAEQKQRRGWQVTPAVGAGVGIGTDGIGAGLGAGIMATPKAESQRTMPERSPSRAQPEAKQQADTSAKREPTPEEKPAHQKDENKPATEKQETTPHAPAPQQKVPFGFAPPQQTPFVKSENSQKPYSLMAPTGATAKRADHSLGTAQARPLQQGSSVKHTAPEHAEHTGEKPRVSSARTQEHTENTQAGNTQNTQDTHTLYDAWLKALKAGEFRVTAKDSRAFVRKQLAGDQKKTHTATPGHCSTISKVFLIRAHHQGHLIANPNTAKNQPRYFLKEES